jgi:hypothetical protein
MTWRRILSHGKGKAGESQPTLPADLDSMPPWARESLQLTHGGKDDLKEYTQKSVAQLPVTMRRLDRIQQMLQDGSFKLPPVSGGGASSSALGPSQAGHGSSSTQGTKGKLDDPSKDS